MTRFSEITVAPFHLRAEERPSGSWTVQLRDRIGLLFTVHGLPDSTAALAAGRNLAAARARRASA